MLETIDKCALFYTIRQERKVANKKRNIITVILPADDFKRFAAYCAATGHKKSTLVARLIRDHLNAERFMLQKELRLDRSDK